MSALVPVVTGAACLQAPGQGSALKKGKLKSWAFLFLFLFLFFFFIYFFFEKVKFCLLESVNMYLQCPIQCFAFP